MTTQAPHLRALLIAGALAVTAAALGWYTLARQQVATPPPPAVTTPVHHHPATAAKPKTAAKTPAPAKAAAKTPAAPKAVAKPAHTTAKPKVVAPKPQAAAKPAPPAQAPPVVRAALGYGLPKPVAEQFAAHAVVVVTLYSPHATVDRLTEAEAQAGAALGGAGFAAVDATKEGPSGALTKLLGLLDPPTTLVFQRPDDATVSQYLVAKAAEPPASPLRQTQSVTPPEFPLYVTLTGYNDRETIAQAARNAEPVILPSAVAPTAWAKSADALCTNASKQLAALGPLRTPAQVKAATPTYHRVGQAYLAKLRTLKAPAGQAGAIKRFVALETQDVALTEQLAVATGRHDSAAAATLTAKEDGISQQAATLAGQLGAIACAQGL